MVYFVFQLSNLLRGKAIESNAQLSACTFVGFVTYGTIIATFAGRQHQHAHDARQARRAHEAH